MWVMGVMGDIMMVMVMWGDEGKEKTKAKSKKSI